MDKQTHRTDGSESPSVERLPILTFILQITWAVADMPPTVGPFGSRAAAEEFARVNVPNGSWEVHPVQYPYRTSATRLTIDVQRGE